MSFSMKCVSAVSRCLRKDDSRSLKRKGHSCNDPSRGVGKRSPYYLSYQAAGRRW